jgi:tRNA nucleotidyltransferase (CCA-adding enzyme)
LGRTLQYLLIGGFALVESSASTLTLPKEVRHIIDKLESQGFDAFAVGGCIRDAFLGHTPKDWDISTSALPEETIACFEGYSIIPTGIQHGTVTVRVNNLSFEVTTFRLDGVYSDGRRPDEVEFVHDIERDLSRRDFTMNALAFNSALVDPFGGVHDIEHKIIRCVGDANRRFSEDALRIMRALRFASVLGFALENTTADALVAHKMSLRDVSVERIANELNRLLLGTNVRKILQDCGDVLAEFLPEIRASFQFPQNNPHHCFDVWEHTAVAISMAPVDSVVRLALLFHDVGKPSCYTESGGVGHFYGHDAISASMAEEALARLNYSTEIRKTVKLLVQYHDQTIIPQTRNIKRWLNKVPLSVFRRLLAVKRADLSAQACEFREERLVELAAVESLLEEIIAEQQCFSLKDLAVNGDDILRLGAQGIEVGKVLQDLLNRVIDEELPNEQRALLSAAEDILRK